MNENKEFLGRGWAYPVTFDPQIGSAAEVAYEKDVKQSILIILETSPGERVMRPDFGCGIHDMVFTAINTAELTRVRESVRTALTKFEARIDLLDVSVDPFEAADGKLIVGIEYRVRRTNQTGNLVYPFFFREGGAA